MPELQEQATSKTLYDRDFYEWSQEMAQLIREQRWSEVDVENLAEEIESLGRRDRSAVFNRLVVLLTHLLKWQFQPGKRSGSWEATIIVQRDRLIRKLNESPSLRSRIEDTVKDAYSVAREAAKAETGLAAGHFPELCPYSSEQVLKQHWLPS